MSSPNSTTRINLFIWLNMSGCLVLTQWHSVRCEMWLWGVRCEMWDVRCEVWGVRCEVVMKCWPRVVQWTSRHCLHWGDWLPTWWSMELTGRIFTCPQQTDCSTWCSSCQDSQHQITLNWWTRGGLTASCLDMETGEPGLLEAIRILSVHYSLWNVWWWGGVSWLTDRTHAANLCVAPCIPSHTCTTLLLLIPWRHREPPTHI